MFLNVAQKLGTLKPNEFPLTLGLMRETISVKRTSSLYLKFKENFKEENEE